MERLKQFFSVRAEDCPQRLDVFLVASMSPPPSRRRARELIARGAVQVNGRRKLKGTLLQAGDVVRIEDQDAFRAVTLAGNAGLRVPVLYEDSDVIVVDKPAGMASHALRTHEARTLANFLLARYPELRSVGKDEREPGLVHRLDTDTSGVVLIARTPAAYAALRRQFAVQSVRKQYLAIVLGRVTSQGEIRTAIASNRKDPRRVRICAGSGAAAGPGKRPALTYYRPLRRLGDCTLLSIEIPTGVRHQIRAHLASVNHPILGDSLYGTGGAERQMLHAHRITFVHPRSGVSIAVESPLPDDMRDEIGSRTQQEPPEWRQPHRRGVRSSGTDR